MARPTEYGPLQNRDFHADRAWDVVTDSFPGVAGALVTTVIGLLVAIPAMFGYNFLITSLRTLIVQTDNYAAELSSEFEHRFVDFTQGR